MAQNKSWLQKYWKQLLILVGIVLALLGAVLGWHWEETADRPFWYNAWPWIAGICIVGWLAAWAYFWNKDKRK